MKVRFFCYLGGGACAEEVVQFTDGSTDADILDQFTPWLEQQTGAGWEVMEEDDEPRS